MTPIDIIQRFQTYINYRIAPENLVNTLLWLLIIVALAYVPVIGPAIVVIIAVVITFNILTRPYGGN